MDIKNIEATTPDIIPAVPEKNCNIWCYDSLNIGGTFPVLNFSLEVNKYAADQSGYTRSPSTGVVLNYPDVFAASESKPKLRQIINLLNEFVEEELAERGLL